MIKLKLNLYEVVICRETLAVTMGASTRAPADVDLFPNATAQSTYRTILVSSHIVCKCIV